MTAAFTVARPSHPGKETRRLEGLDMARAIALVGMVIVNFNLAMVTSVERNLYQACAELFQGKAAATFVVLAGIGLGLSAKKSDWRKTVRITIRRSLFLLALGLLNTLVFSADIIHYYAFYFLIGVWFLRAPTWFLIISIGGFLMSFVVLVVVLDYDNGWNWDSLQYVGFWSPSGFTRNLLFNGWHPVFPWCAFLLLGIQLSRLDLRARRTQKTILMWGIVASILASIVSSTMVSFLGPEIADLAVFFGTSSIPPMPLYMVSGAGWACATIGLCLLLESPVRSIGLLGLITTPGRQSLTIYMSHILIGMGTIEALGMIGTTSARNALVVTFVFCLLATILASIWSRFFTRGPLEFLMRTIAG